MDLVNLHIRRVVAAAHKLVKKVIPKNPAGITGIPQDPRSDSGYGTLKTKFHSPRSFNQYPEQSAEEEEELIDDKTYSSVLSKLLNYKPVDHLSKNKTDPFYFAGAATKMSETSTAKGMVPFPKMYKGRTSGGTGGAGASLPYAGPTSGFRTSSRPTGTKKGISSAPYPKVNDDTDLKYRISDIINSDVDSEHIKNLKDMIFMIHKEQEDKK